MSRAKTEPIREMTSAQRPKTTSSFAKQSVQAEGGTLPEVANMENGTAIVQTFGIG
jgi:hypothetical protein